VKEGALPACRQVGVVKIMKKTKRVLIVSRNGTKEKEYSFLAFHKKGEKIHTRFLNVLGTPHDLTAILSKNAIDEVYLDLPSLTPEEMFQLREGCPKRTSRIHFISHLYHELSQRINLREVNGTPLLTLKGKEIKGIYQGIKRGMDLFGATLALLVLAPLMGIIALLIKATMPGPVLFRQKRLGKGGEYFNFYKFRTMKDNGKNPHKEFVVNFIKNSESSREVYKLRDDPRITRLGYFLRRTSLDELPQLINVLRGEMSLIGPRPPIPYEFECYQDWHKRRMSVKPGMTGLWQVSGRSSVTFNDMVLLDLYYIDNWTLWLDLLILLKTIPSVLSEKGAY